MSERGEFKWRSSFEGVVGNLTRRYRETQSEEIREWIEAFMTPRACPECKGARLKASSLAVRIGKRNISDLTHLSVRDGLAAVEELAPEGRDHVIAGPIVKEIRDRLRFLVGCRLDLPDARSGVGHPLGRGGAADPPGNADRQPARRRPLHPGRAVDRPAPPGQRPIAGDPDATARSWKYRRRCRARPRHDDRRRPPHRPGSRRGTAWGTPGNRGHAAGGDGARDLADGAVPFRAPRDSVAREASGGQRRGDRGRRGQAQQPQGHHRSLSSRQDDLRHRRLGIGEVIARQ